MASTPPIPVSSKRCAVPQVDCSSGVELRRLLWGRTRPLVIRGFEGAMPGLRGWTPERLRARCGDVPVVYNREPKEAASLTAGAQQRMRVRARLAEYLEVLEDPPASERLNLLLSDLATRVPELAADLGPLWACLPLPQALQPRLARGPMVWIGPGDAASPIHADPEHNLFAQLHGCKDWLLYPPAAGRDLYAPWPEHGDAYLHWSPIDPARPVSGSFPRFAELPAEHHLLRPGELLYVPAGWWHLVRYEGIAVSANLFWRDLLALWTNSRIIAARLRRMLFRGVGAARLLPRIERAALFGWRSLLKTPRGL